MQMLVVALKMKPRNSVAKDLRTPKYRMRVVALAKIYNRKREEQKLRREINYAQT
jgi:hypothetical protein